MQTRYDYLNDTHQPTNPHFAGLPGAARPSHRSKRTHTWHASYAVLAVMTSLLLLSGCDKKGTAEQAGTEADKAVQTAPENAAPPSAGYPADPAMTAPGPAQDAGKTMDDSRENPAENPANTGEPAQQP